MNYRDKTHNCSCKHFTDEVLLFRREPTQQAVNDRVSVGILSRGTPMQILQVLGLELHYL